MPNCNSNSVCSSGRRSSRASNNSYIMMNTGSGRFSAASSRRSSTESRTGSRRGSTTNSFVPMNYARSNPAVQISAMPPHLPGNEHVRGSLSSLSTPSTQQQQSTSSSGGGYSLLHTIGSGVVGSSSYIYYTRNRYRNYSTATLQRPKFRF